MDEYALSPLGFDEKRRQATFGNYYLEEHRDANGYFIRESAPTLPNGDYRYGIALYAVDFDFCS